MKSNIFWTQKCIYFFARILLLFQLSLILTYRTHTNALLHHNFIYDFPFCSWPRLPIIHKKMIWSSFYQMYQYQQTHSLYVEYSRPSEVQFFFKFSSAFWHSCITNFELSSTYIFQSVLVDGPFKFSLQVWQQLNGICRNNSLNNFEEYILKL